MPSAEKLSSEALKVEGASVSDPKVSENAQKDQEQQQNNGGEKTISPIQQVIQIINNKVRNLEKRKNKLDGYIKEEEDGNELSSEQKKAVLKYEEVVSQLAISKEFSKQFQTIATAASKEAKREARKATFLRQMQETTKVREVVMIQDILRQLKNDEIRNDFLKAQNGACLVEPNEMNVLEQFSKYTTPIHPTYSNEPSFSNSAKVSADHFSFVVDGRPRQFMETGFTYEKIKELFQRIQSCGYFEKDIEIVEEAEPQQLERPAESATPQTDDLESGKEDKPTESISNSSNNMQGGVISSSASSSSVPSVIPQQQLPLPPEQVQPLQQHQHAVAPAMMPSAPLPTQIPNPQFFNGNVSGIMPVISQQQIQPQPMKTTVTAVENAFFNQMKYSQPQGPMNPSAMPPNRYVEDFASANISFLQDSLVEQNVSGSQQQQQQPVQQKMPPNANSSNNLVNQPKHSPIQQVQQQGISTQTFTNQNFHPQQPQQQQPNFPPGLKLQNASNIPVNYSPQQQQVPPPHVPSQTQQQVVANVSIPPSNTNSSIQYQALTQAKVQNLQDHHSHLDHHQQPQQQQQQQQPQHKSNAQHHSIDASCDKNENADRKMHGHEKEKGRNGNNEWNQANNQPPQIDTWNNESAGANTQTGNGNNSYSRFNRNNNRGSGGGSKYNNYRNSQQSRNNYNNENANGDRDAGGSSTTFFRNNERYNSSNGGSGGGGGGRYNNNMGDRGGYKPREGNYRAGSGRFPSNLGGNTQGNSSGQGLRK